MKAEGTSCEPDARQLASGLICRLRDDMPVRIREIRPDDEPLMVRFHADLSDRSVYLRYFAHLSLAHRASHARLARICVSDHQRNIVLVALIGEGAESEAQIVGVGRLCRIPDKPEAEFAVVVADRWQRRGLGGMLIAQLVALGRQDGVARIFGVMLGENRAMRSVCERADFSVRRVAGESELVAELNL